MLYYRYLEKQPDNDRGDKNEGKLIFEDERLNCANPHCILLSCWSVFKEDPNWNLFDDSVIAIVSRSSKIEALLKQRYCDKDVKMREVEYYSGICTNKSELLFKKQDRQKREGSWYHEEKEYRFRIVVDHRKATHTVIYYVNPTDYIERIHIKPNLDKDTRCKLLCFAQSRCGESNETTWPNLIENYSSLLSG
jgi:hypothetical protein